MRHLSDEQIEDFTRLTLTPSEIAPVEEHLLICESCRERVVAAEDYAASMRRALEDVGPQPEDKKTAAQRQAFGKHLN